MTTCYYEFMHCIQHLAFKPKWAWVQHMKQRHMEHHFFDENGNFGITNYLWDRMLGTYYEKKDRPKRSADGVQPRLRRGGRPRSIRG